jgi:hypothetical protein
MGNQEIEDIEYIFGKILGTKLNAHYYNDKKTTFIKIVSLLEYSSFAELDVFDNHFLDISNFTDGLWDALDMLMGLYFGEKVSNIVGWYIFNRLDDDRNITPLQDESGNLYIISTPEELYDFIEKYDLEGMFEEDEDEEDEEDEDEI